MKTKIAFVMVPALALALGASAHGGLVWGVENFAIADWGNSNVLVTFDSDNPSDLTFIGAPGVGFGLPDDLFGGLDWHPNGNLYAYSQTNNLLYTIDPVTGLAALVGGGGTQGETVTGMTYSPDGNMYLIANGGSTGTVLYTVDVNTGLASNRMELGGPASLPIDIAANSAGQLFVHDIINDIMLEIVGGNLVPLPNGHGWNANFSQGMSINWSVDDQWLVATINAGAGNADELWQIDAATGLGTFLGETGAPGLTNEFGDIAFTIIPAPGSLALLGLAGFFGRRRRRS
ncbi:MAG: PEP-CTERM sorting domain-containing protein [Planctomycetes bacterium]|nr:PEP-CTERM sorting domain-containing protein [Planctomycetota bacterium]